MCESANRLGEAGGFISAPTGAAPDADVIPIPKDHAEDAFDAATCIGCGACVAACPNGSAALFLGAKLTHLGLLPQGQPERDSRALGMIDHAMPRPINRRVAGAGTPLSPPWPLPSANRTG